MVSLSLGTAQWGDPYGVTNQVGRLTDASVSEIVSIAIALGIADLDTAPGYGDAERRIAPWSKDFAVTTKVRGGLSISARDQVTASLVTLGCQAVDACLVHDWSSLTPSEAQRVAADLETLRTEGVVGQVGISAYDSDDVGKAQDAFSSLDRVQVPVNILDRRLVSDRLILQSWESGTRFIARSVFLQGLLATDADTGLGKHPDVMNFHEVCRRQRISPTSAALDFVRCLPWISQLVVGVTSAAELENLGEIWAAAPMANLIDCSSLDLDLIDPRRWRT